MKSMGNGKPKKEGGRDAVSKLATVVFLMATLTVPVRYLWGHGDTMLSIYTLISVLAIHLIMWLVGFYRSG